MIWKQAHGQRLSKEDVDQLSETIIDYEKKFPDDEPDQIRIVAIARQVQIANALVDGNYLELGTLFGHTLRIIHRYMDSARTLYSFDTFTGFDERDLKVERSVYRNKWHIGNFLSTSPDAVAEYLGRPTNLRLIDGWFPESFGPFDSLVWRFVHIDVDLFQPTLTALETLWPRMVPGGVIMVHDYGCSSFRTNIAVDQFCDSIGFAPVELPDRYGTAVLRKPMNSGLLE